jgi:hypothetical protein
MNSKNDSRPRVFCRVVRLWASLRGAASSGHAASCPECRRYFAACDALESDLRRAAPSQQMEAPTGLEHGIMRAIAAESRPVAAPRISVGRFALAAAAAALAMFATFARWWPEHPPRGTGTDSSRDIAGIAAAAEAFSDEWLNSKLPAASAVALDNPLRQELDGLQADARSALDFLALNFLPSTAASVAPTRPAGGKG